MAQPVSLVSISATIRADQRDNLITYMNRAKAVSLSDALRDVLDWGFEALAANPLINLNLAEPNAAPAESPT